MNVFDAVFVIIMMIVCATAGFILGMIYGENEANKRRKSWQDHLPEGYESEERTRNNK